MPNDYLQKIASYFATQPIKKAWLFGSFAREEASADSDIDILVVFNDNIRIGMKFIEMIGTLEQMLNRTVDLVEEKTLLPWVRPTVEKERILIYERKLGELIDC